MGLFDDLIPNKSTASLQPPPNAPSGMFDDLVPAPAEAPPAAKPQAEMRSYEPTWREKIAQYMMGDERASPERERLVGGLMGTTGLPGSEQIGVVDVTPARIPLFGQEAVREGQAGNYGKAALNALGATPAPVINKAVGAVASRFAAKPGLPAVADRVAGGADDAAEAASAAAPRRMSPAELKAQSQAAYKEADEAGVIFNDSSIARVLREVSDDLAEHAYHPKLQPNIDPVLEEMARLSQGNVTFKGVDTLRKMLRPAVTSANESERMLAGRIIERLDDFMANPKASEVLAGNSAKASSSITNAREIWGRMRRTELLEDAVGRADLRAASTGSGGNTQNATRQNLRAILDNPKKARMFTPAERKVIESVVRGTTTQNSLRLLGKLSPEGSGLMMGLGLGATWASPAMVAAPIMGFVAKRLSDRGMTKSVDRLITMVSSGQARPMVVTKWAETADKVKSGALPAAALMITSQALARQLAQETGEDEKAITDALMESVGDA